MAPTQLIPLTKLPDAPLPPTNGGNTCYLDSVLVALFAEFDAWDGLLQSPTPTPLVSQMQFLVNNLRTGRGISPDAINRLRDTLIHTASWPPGRGQQDAAELFSSLLDALNAPFVPLVQNLEHSAMPDDADYSPFTERLLWLTLSTDRRQNSISAMLDRYFYGDVLRNLRRDGAPTGVDANVVKSLIPGYTPTRETGESVSVSRNRFSFLTVPLAVARFSPTGEKNCAAIHVPMVLPATRYLGAFSSGLQHSLILRSVVCHLGTSVRSGHYVAYTYTPTKGWRRWDDLDGGTVPSVSSDVGTGEPENKTWAEEMRHNCYLLFYELVPGEGLQGRCEHLYEDGRYIQMQLDAEVALLEQTREDAAGAAREQMRVMRGEPRRWDGSGSRMAPGPGFSVGRYGRGFGGGAGEATGLKQAWKTEEREDGRRSKRLYTDVFEDPFCRIRGAMGARRWDERGRGR